MTAKTIEYIMTRFTITLLAASIISCSLQTDGVCRSRKAADTVGGPFGWAVCTSLDDAGSFNLNGGAAAGNRKAILKSNGGDMSEAIENAIKENDVIVLDGSNGTFLMSRAVILTGVDNKTVYGINNAVLQTSFYLSSELQARFDEADLEHRNPKTSQEPLILSNGKRCKNERTFVSSQIIMDYTQDPSEAWLKSGCFWLYTCSNWIIRNLTMIGPGSMSNGRTGDVLTLSKKCTHIWIDHCVINDGLDGNLDVNTESDFITVSWCRLNYTDRSYAHRLCSLVGGNVNTLDVGHLNITYAYCVWPDCEKGVSRQPMVRYGHAHIYNCYYPSKRSGTLIHARDGSHMRIENNYFANCGKYFADSLSCACANIGNYTAKPFSPVDKGEIFSPPYKYKAADAMEVPDIVFGRFGTGATLALDENSY